MVWTRNIQPLLLAKPEIVRRKKYPLQPIDWRIQNARFLSSKNGRSSPIPRAIGAAGERMSGVSAGDERRRVVGRSSNVALSVAIAGDIGQPSGRPKGNQ